MISPSGLSGAFSVYQKMILALENNYQYQVTCLCEPQLGKRGLYPTVSQKGSYDTVKAMTDFLAYADGKNDLIDISSIIHVPVEDLIPIAEKMIKTGIIRVVNNTP